MLYFSSFCPIYDFFLVELTCVSTAVDIEDLLAKEHDPEHDDELVQSLSTGVVIQN